jgi:hypothetical protein
MIRINGTFSGLDICIVPRTRLAADMTYGITPCFAPSFGSILTFSVELMVVAQSRGTLQPLKNDTFAICIIGDDLNVSLGPSAFTQRSLKAYTCTCGTTFDISCEQTVTAHTCAATEAALILNNDQLDFQRGEAVE